MIPAALVVILAFMGVSVASTCWSVQQRHDRRARGRADVWWSIATVVWTIAVGGFWALGPSVSGDSTTVYSDGTSVTSSYRRSMFENEGAGVLVVLTVPVVIALGALLAQRLAHARRWRFLAAGVLLVGCVLGAASIGLPYFPAVLALVAAAAATRGPTPVRPAGTDLLGWRLDR